MWTERAQRTACVAAASSRGGLGGRGVPHLWIAGRLGKGGAISPQTVLSRSVGHWGGASAVGAIGRFRKRSRLPSPPREHDPEKNCRRERGGPPKKISGACSGGAGPMLRERLSAPPGICEPSGTGREPVITEVSRRCSSGQASRRFARRRPRSGLPDPEKGARPEGS